MYCMTDNPLKKSERINELDIFRGFAILGIFMVNILVMNVCFAYRAEWEAEQTGWLQAISFFILENVFYSKFFTIFSFLFGIGVALQIKQSKAKGNYSNLFFLRRFGSLFFFGVLHIVLLWAGDILHIYGMLGVLLLFLFRLPAKLLLGLAIMIFIFPFFNAFFEQIMEWLSFDYSAPLAELSRAEILVLKHHGSYYSGIVLRLKEYAFASGLIYSAITPIALSMMLLGGYIVKMGWLENLYERILRIKPYLLISLGVFLIYRFTVYYWVLPTFNIPHGSPISITLITLFQISDVLISFSLLWFLGYLWNKGIGRWLISKLQFVGRMALSNYILQSILGYLVMRTFNGYEYFSAFGCIILVLSIYSFQIIISQLWLTKFQFGPLEWAWRCISYVKILPIRKSM
jgi:uncharacterized protein